MKYSKRKIFFVSDKRKFSQNNSKLTKVPWYLEYHARTRNFKNSLNTALSQPISVIIVKRTKFLREYVPLYTTTLHVLRYCLNFRNPGYYSPRTFVTLLPLFYVCNGDDVQRFVLASLVSVFFVRRDRSREVGDGKSFVWRVSLLNN